jgi:DNA-binding SARP family transcriptional activator
VQIRLIGELEIRRGKQAIPLPASKRTRALLGYLVATGRTHLRAHLCDLLWESPDDPRAALRWSLAKLRPLLDEPDALRIVADRERVGFVAQGAQVDWLQVRQALSGGVERTPTDALRSVSAVFRGEFLEGLELPDCHRYQLWCLAEREAVRAQRISVLAELAERLRNEPSAALPFARERLAVDPLSEAAHLAVIRLLGEMGRNRDALRQYETCRDLLRNELGVAPSHELERVRTGLGKGESRPIPPVIDTAAAPASRPASSPLVGRVAEMAFLRARVEAARRGEGGCVLLLGEPGIGKTRVLQELASEARSARARVLSGRAFEAEGVRAYGVWIDALRSAALSPAADAVRAGLSRLLPELGEAPRDGDRTQLLEGVMSVLEDEARAQGLLLVVLDDIQWLDEASAGLMHYVARASTGSRILLACGARPGEIEDNPSTRRVLRALNREGRLRSLELGPLGRDETAQLALGLAPGIDVERVFAESEGHPLFAIEVARALAQGRQALSDTLSGLIADRLACLGEPARDLLGWAAALGRRFDIETLVRSAGLPPSEASTSIAEIERHRLLRPEHGDAAGYDFVHDLIRQAAYRSISAPRRRLMHGQIARTLDAVHDPDGALAADVAHHAALGGEHELAASSCVRAGRRCLRLFALAEAAELATRGLGHLPPLPDEKRLPLKAALLRLYVHSGMPEARVRSLEAELPALAREAEEAGLPDAARAALDVLTFVHWYTGDLARAHSETLQAAELGRATEPEAAARALAATARCLAHLDRDLSRAETLLVEARALAGPGAAAIVDIDWGLGLLALHAGDYDTAGRLLDGALDRARDSGHRYAEWDCQIRLAMMELERNRPDAALVRIHDLADLVEKMGEGSEPHLTSALAALARFALAEPGAEQAVSEALDRLRQIDSKWMLAYALTFASALEIERGRFDLARPRSEEALQAAEAVGRRSEAALARALLARAALEAGEEERARALLEALAPDLALPRALSARVRAAVTLIARRLGLVLAGS